MNTASGGPVDLSVVIPVHNAGRFIQANVRQLAAWLATLRRVAELIVVDDGSTDGTGALVEQVAEDAPIAVQVIQTGRNQGKGAAVVRGMSLARGRQRVFLDADLAYPPSEIGRICEALASGADVAIASRVHRDSRYVIQPSFFRYLYTRHLAGRLFNLIVRCTLLPGIRDTQAGLKGFTAGTADRLFQEWLPLGFSFDLAVLFRARRLGLRIEQVPVLYRYDSEPTTVRFLADTLAVLRDIARMRVKATLRTDFRPGPKGMASSGRAAGNLTPAARDRRAKPLLLTFDVEEFDWPAERGVRLSEAEQIGVTEAGLRRILPVLGDHGVRATFFITGRFAQARPGLVRELVDRGHEPAVHGLRHDDEYHTLSAEVAVTRLRQAREIVEAVAGRRVVGVRLPRLRQCPPSVLRDAGFSYDATPHPTWMPGRYNGLRWPRRPWREDGILRVPISVLPVARLPISWIWFRLAGPALSHLAANVALVGAPYLHIYFHPWEARDLRPYGIPSYLATGTGEPFVRALDRFLARAVLHLSPMPVEDFAGARTGPAQAEATADPATA